VTLTILLLLARLVAVVAEDLETCELLPEDEGVREYEVDFVGDSDGRTGGRLRREEFGEVAM